MCFVRPSQSLASPKFPMGEAKGGAKCAIPFGLLFIPTDIEATSWSSNVFHVFTSSAFARTNSFPAGCLLLRETRRFVLMFFVQWTSGKSVFHRRCTPYRVQNDTITRCFCVKIECFQKECCLGTVQSSTEEKAVFCQAFICNKRETVHLAS